MRFVYWLAIVVLVSANTSKLAAGEFPAPTSKELTRPQPAVEIAALRYQKPRPNKAWVVTIDLTSADLEFVVTSGDRKVAGYELFAETTLAFAQRTECQLAINASPFEPIRLLPNEGINIDGLSVSDGMSASPASANFGALLFSVDHRAAIVGPATPESAPPFPVHDAVGGFDRLIIAGKISVANGSDKTLHPRTAAGIAKDGKRLMLIIVDGRQRGVSEGVSVFELAQIGAQNGCHDLLNLDGGGSTTLVVEEPQKPGEWKVRNTPVGVANAPGTLRQNGNNLGLRVYTAGRFVSAAQLKAIMPNLTPERLATFLGPINQTMIHHAINTPLRRAAFLAQLAHESGEFRYMEEIASGEAYEGRKDIGNTQPGDGKRYKGRGPIQLTGRANYRAAGKALGYDLENEPTLAARPDVGCLVAGWFWTTRKLNELADQKDFEKVTRRVNGGLRGFEARKRYYQRALTTLGAETNP